MIHLQNLELGPCLSINCHLFVKILSPTTVGTSAAWPLILTAVAGALHDGGDLLPLEALLVLVS